MRYLGVDYGSKRVGIAISSEDGSFSFPLNVLINDENLINNFLKICEDNNVSEIIIGESKNFSQEENEIMKEIKNFIELLKIKTNIPIKLHPEFLTSQEAERLQGKNEMLDASAAALILRHYLDLKNNNL